MNHTVKAIVLIAFGLVVNLTCSAQRSVKRMTVNNNELQRVLSNLFSKQRQRTNVFLLNVKDLRDTVFISLVPLDSGSVSLYLGNSIKKVIGYVEFQGKMVLVFGQSKYFFEPTDASIKLNYLKKTKWDNRFPPVPIDAFAITYFYSDSRFVIYSRYMPLFGK